MSLSLPAKATTQIKAQAKQRGFKSLSAYIKHLVELDKDLISERELWNSVKEARREYHSGQSVKARSIFKKIHQGVKKASQGNNLFGHKEREGILCKIFKFPNSPTQS